jgi:D-alanyl-lipoteichoic acid acyltransferase DltB (MBOAT superfamily)
MDLSDAQWRGFRTSFPTLFGVALVTAPLVAVARRALGPNAMPAFHAAYGAAAAAYLHGARSVWIVSITCAHYCVCVTFAGRPKIGLAAVWTSALAALAAAQFAAPDWSFARLGGDALAPLDARALQGVLPRWWVHFNLLVLRLISFGADLHRRRLETRDSGVVRDSETKASRNAKERLFGGAAPAAAEDDVRDARACSVETDPAHFAPRSLRTRTTKRATGGVEDAAREEGDDANEHRDDQPALESRAAYSFFEYFAYCLYPPLYLAGPTCVFHKFAPQLYRAQTTHSRRAVARYALVKFALVFLLLEVWTHLVYTNAMALGRVWTRGATFGPFEVGATSLATLNFMYLKFTVMWRFFRLWALASGVEAPENMLRCVNNNATILGFWKGWHASYNKWLVRYVYVPLGGAKYRLLNAWAVFFFVAAWHDKMNRRLLGWSVIFAAFLAPELLVGAIGRKAFPTAESRDSVVFRCLRSFAGAVNVHVLIAGNMVGYVVGLDGLDELARAYFSRGTRDALEFLAWSLLTCAAAAHVGFEQRAGEMRVKARTHAPAGKAAKRS